MAKFIEFGPEPDDVTVGGVRNSITTADDVAAMVEFVNSGRARNFTASPGVIVDGGGDPNSLHVVMSEGGGGVSARDVIDLHVGFGARGAGDEPTLVNAIADYLKYGTPTVPATLAHRILKPTILVLRHMARMPEGVVFFANDSAVAVDAAIRIALNHRTRCDGLELDGCDAKWREYQVVYAAGGYHGSGGFERSFFTSAKGRVGFGPLHENVRSVPFGDIGALRERFESGEKIAAVILEPVQGGGGCVAPPAGYLAAVGALCKRHGTVYIVDETKSGFGRLGEHFYSPTVGANPDLICGGKSAAAGLFAAAFVIGKPEIMRGFESGVWGVTWCGYPLQCMAILRFAALLEDGLLEEVRRKAHYLETEIEALRLKHREHIVKFDGLGLMRSLETVFPASAVARALMVRGVYTTPIVHPDIADEVPRRVYIAPALTITDSQIDKMVRALDESLSELAG